MSAELVPEWTPGDPLHEWDSRPHRNLGLYSFRKDPVTEECHCGDSRSEEVV